MKLAFIIPYYNHPLKINLLVQKLKEYGYYILLVDDGSDTKSKEALKSLDIDILTLQANQGKGAALKHGFKYLLKLGFTHAFQIDADMQHDLKSIKPMIDLIDENIFVCAKPIYNNAPKSRFYGRKITNFWMYINTLGTDIKDGMCGMRIYPLIKLENAFKKCKTNRMEFDIDILYYAHKDGLNFRWYEVFTDYPIDGISHFNAFKDNINITLTHAKHFFLLPTLIFRKFFK